MLTFCTDCEKQKQKIRRLKEKRKEKMVSRRCLSPSIKLFKSNKLFFPEGALSCYSSLNLNHKTNKEKTQARPYFLIVTMS